MNVRSLFEIEEFPHTFCIRSMTGDLLAYINLRSWIYRDGIGFNYDQDQIDELLVKQYNRERKKRPPVDGAKINEIQYIIKYVNIKKQLIIPFFNLDSSTYKFDELESLGYQIYRNLEDLGYIYLSSIQKAMTQFIMKNKDMVANSPTGTGKTLAYLFPLVSKMIITGSPIDYDYIFEKKRNEKLNKKTKLHPVSLILLPTRDLSEQVFKQARMLCRKIGIKTVNISGDNKDPISKIVYKYGCDILIGTPGKIIDLCKNGDLTLSCVTTLVLDEADRLFDYDFLPQVTELLTKLDLTDKNERQNIFCSATFNYKIEETMKTFLNDYYLFIPKGDSTKRINQRVEIIKNNTLLFSSLCEELQQLNGNTLIFVNSKDTLITLTKQLKEKNFQVESFSNDLSHENRYKLLNAFIDRELPILVSTDILSRGIDFPSVSNVINYELPNTIDIYYHRIGRTGRMGQSGNAISYIVLPVKAFLTPLYVHFIKSGFEIPYSFKECVLDEIKKKKEIFSSNNKDKQIQSYPKQEGYNVNNHPFLHSEKEFHNSNFNTKENRENRNRKYERNDYSRNRPKSMNPGHRNYYGYHSHHK